MIEKAGPAKFDAPPVDSINGLDIFVDAGGYYLSAKVKTVSFDKDGMNATAYIFLPDGLKEGVYLSLLRANKEVVQRSDLKTAGFDPGTLMYVTYHVSIGEAALAQTAAVAAADSLIQERGRILGLLEVRHRQAVDQAHYFVQEGNTTAANIWTARYAALAELRRDIRGDE